MAPNPFIDEEFRVLTPEAFDFVLANELKRAVRSQNYLTLLVVEASSAEPGQPSSPEVLREIGRVVSREVRETDLLSETREGQLSVVLLDADLPNSMQVVDRLTTRFKHYRFPTRVAIEIGAACCPTHGADADTLRRAAETHDVRARDGRENASNAQ